MGSKSAGLVGIVAALAFGLGAAAEVGHAQTQPAGVHVVADDQGPTVIGKDSAVQAGATDDQGPTVIGKSGVTALAV
ncbi:hypothetical protein [Streptomyces sp. ITFR-16]|uniref:hypothetical protein n=1 Tax=Streptomyces sp. ITFR-16 TaxID=3075198 RepID=UPI002889FEB3|nr:hypothetical protein [Streptomyces sp. ITFR-16]WNI27188.1 hypothetical protein RLT58_35175 [Streptomyces sp. ITFR-16]